MSIIVVKRSFDVLVSFVLVIVTLPLALAIGIAVKVGSRGPILYRQTRVGKGGREFTILKFRSMVVDADRLAPNLSATGDPRVTTVGRFIRATYLDELPQLVNVLRGDMSLVGPRPETPEYVALYTPEERRVLSVRPGLAGPSTLAYMDEGALLAATEDAEGFYVSTILHDRVRLDLGYLDDMSLARDVQILFRQVLAIFGKGLA